MERPVDTKIEDLKKLILSMGGSVEKALEEAIESLVRRDKMGFKRVHQIEEKINEDQIKVDNACLAFLAKQGPVAKDLRLILSLVKINTDLERMGDQCVNIAHTGLDYLGRAPLSTTQRIGEMSKVVRTMVKDSLDCFVRIDEEKAQLILAADDEVDAFKQEIFETLLNHMKTNPGDVEAALDLILIARNLERLGDHATNIAEDVIFVSSGKDVRHGGKSSAGPSR